MRTCGSDHSLIVKLCTYIGITNIPHGFYLILAEAAHELLHSPVLPHKHSTKKIRRPLLKLGPLRRLQSLLTNHGRQKLQSSTEIPHTRHFLSVSSTGDRLCCGVTFPESFYKCQLNANNWTESVHIYRENRKI